VAEIERWDGVTIVAEGVGTMALGLPIVADIAAAAAAAGTAEEAEKEEAEDKLERDEEDDGRAPPLDAGIEIFK